MATLDDVFLAVVIILGVIFVPWVFLIRPWLRQRKAAQLVEPAAPAVVDLAERRPPYRGWSMRGELARLFLVADDMSNDRQDNRAGGSGAGQVRHQLSGPVSVSAMPNTADTERVSGVDLDADPRAIVRAALIAELLDNGIITNRDKAICVAFHCSKASSSRPEAPFQKALRLVEQHRAKARPEYVGDMIARVEREVAEQH